MRSTELILFERLKREIQEKYLESHAPSLRDISQWKGIDIIYFQEDLRKVAKGNLSEKSFYTYFKSSPTKKLPRIDMLNLLANYIGFDSWYEFKKIQEPYVEPITSEKSIEKNEKPLVSVVENTIINPEKRNSLKKTKASITRQMKTNIWLSVSFVLTLIVFFLIFKDDLFGKTYTYCFTDGDRNTPIRDVLEIRITKENESPLLYKIKPGDCFIYKTKDKNVNMMVSSPFYKDEVISRNLENAPERENIELRPDDNAIMLYYYSKSIKDLKRKREELNRLISNNATIYQVFDNEFYGVETLTKEKYITLVTLPSTSLENLQVLEIQMDKERRRIIKIKFKIKDNEKP